MTSSLQPTLPPGHRLHWLEETGSTNDDARRLGEAGEQGPLWIAARRQTKGRGRRGRVWDSPEGNLHATLLINPGCSRAEASQLAFVAALAALSLAEAFLPPEEWRALSVKWPNDLLLRGRKLAGLLLESDSGSSEVQWLAAGIGINLAHAPAQAAFPAIALAECAPPPPPLEALAELARAFDTLMKVWRGEEGFARIRALWLERAQGMGEEIAVRLPAETLEGRFEDLDEQGALLLRGSDGAVRRILAGDVFFPATLPEEGR